MTTTSTTKEQVLSKARETVQRLPGTVAEAKAKVDALARAEVDRYRQRASARQRLFEAQQAQDFKKAAVIREEVEYLEDTETGRKERRAEILALFALQAQELEDKIAALRPQISERETKAKTLLAQLEDVEDTDMRVHYLINRKVMQDLHADVDAMESKIRMLRRSQVIDYGIATGNTADELIEALMRKPEVLGPPIASIYERVEKVKGLGFKGQYLQMKWVPTRIDELEWHGLSFENS